MKGRNERAGEGRPRSFLGGGGRGWRTDFGYLVKKQYQYRNEECQSKMVSSRLFAHMFSDPLQNTVDSLEKKDRPTTKPVQSSSTLHPFAPTLSTPKLWRLPDK